MNTQDRIDELVAKYTAKGMAPNQALAEACQRVDLERIESGGDDFAATMTAPAHVVGGAALPALGPRPNVGKAVKKEMRRLEAKGLGYNDALLAACRAADERTDALMARFNDDTSARFCTDPRTIAPLAAPRELTPEEHYDLACQNFKETVSRINLRAAQRAK